LAEPFNISIPLPQNTLLPDAGTNFGPFEILSIKTNNSNSGDTLLELQLIAYDTGQYRLSEVMPGIIMDTSYFIKVTLPPENEIKEYGQLKEITIPAAEVNNLPPVWLIMLIVAVLGFVLFYFLRRKKKPEDLAFSDTKEDAIDILNHLKIEWAKNTITSTELGERLIHALHVHFKVSTKKSIAALYKAINRQATVLNKEEVKKCLRLSDAWRFGKQHADKATGDHTIEAITELILQPATGAKNQTHV
jgi:hypothetical protein